MPNKAVWPFIVSANVGLLHMSQSALYSSTKYIYIKFKNSDIWKMLLIIIKGKGKR